MPKPADTSNFRWTIVEDALRDQSGHWFEYVRTFVRALEQCGDHAIVLVDRNAAPFIRNGLPANPILPPSIWHRMSDRSGTLARIGRIPIHAFKTFVAMRRYLSRQGSEKSTRNPSREFPELFFVPTVLVHSAAGRDRTV